MITELSPELRIVSYEYGWKLERPRSRNGKTDFEAFKWFETFRRALEEAGNYSELGSFPRRARSLLAEWRGKAVTCKRGSTSVPSQMHTRKINRSILDDGLQLTQQKSDHRSNR